METEFLSPRLVGDRFAKHSIPLEVLKDLYVLEEMVTEIARSKYLSEHHGRKRVPKGFTKGVELRISDITEGSAIPKIMLVAAGVLLLPEAEYFEAARDDIIHAISAAEKGESITEHLAAKSLGYFDRLGRSLRKGEWIEFNVPRTREVAKLDKTTRKRLIEASEIREFTEEILLRGSVPEVDQDDLTFEIQLIDGKKVKAPLLEPHTETVMDAFVHYPERRRVRIDGIGRFDRHGNLKAVETVEHVNVLEPLDVSSRLEELRLLKRGWLDGEGEPISLPGLEWLDQAMTLRFPDDRMLPHIFPTPEGNVQLEWSTPTHEINLEISLEDKTGLWTSVALNADGMEENDLDLGNEDDWQWWLDRVPLGEEAEA